MTASSFPTTTLGNCNESEAPGLISVHTSQVSDESKQGNASLFLQNGGNDGASGRNILIEEQ
jgi:hypothetical protein